MTLAAVKGSRRLRWLWGLFGRGSAARLCSGQVGRCLTKVLGLFATFAKDRLINNIFCELKVKLLFFPNRVFSINEE
jgi:hypothetical protein